MTITADIPTTAPAHTDHTISIETAADHLTVKPATVRRYLRTGKLARRDSGVSANSVEVYRAARTANQERTRFKKTPKPTDDLAVLTDVELAAEAWAEAGRLEALARKLKAQARPILNEAGEGLHGRFDVRFTAGRTVMDQDAVREDYEGRGEEVPVKVNAPSIKVVRVA